MRRRLFPAPAFTLVEILAALAVVAVLGALTLPSLKRAVETAKSAKCVSNLRQIGIACQAYAAQNNGAPPEPIDAYESSYESRSAWEYGTIKAVGLGKLQYAGLLGGSGGVAVTGAARSPVFHCPAQRAHNGWAYANTNWIDYSYLLTGRYLRDVYTKPGTAVAADVQGGQAMQFGQPGHPGYANVLYVDGAVAAVPYSVYSTTNRAAAAFDRGYLPPR